MKHVNDNYESYPITSRGEAIERGMTYYRPPRLCKRGHKSLRRAPCGTCLECARYFQSRTSEEARQKHNKRTVKWRKENPEYYKRYRSDPEKSARMYAATMKNLYKDVLANGYTTADDAAIAAMFLEARKLGQTTGTKHCVVHLVPIRYGGKHGKDNVAVMSLAASKLHTRRMAKANKLAKVIQTVNQLIKTA